MRKAKTLLHHRNHLLAVTLIAVTLIAFGAIFSGDQLKSSIMDAFDDATYQSVYLDNEMTYFGKVTEAGENFITLTDVFYFLDGSKEKLVKRSDESLTINSAHIVSTENLDSDNAVLKAILQYNENK